MSNVIYLQDQKEWADITLAKRSLKYYSNPLNNPNPDVFNWDVAIDYTENLIRSFMNSLKDRVA